MKHDRVNYTTCSCGYTNTSYRGLNSHIGNCNRNNRLRNEDD